MNPKLRAELDRIGEFLAGPNGAALADVLSALRGPDSNDVALKERTTTLIRRAAFPQLLATPISEGSASASSWSLQVNVAGIILPLPRDHFSNHIKSAADALGLPWRNA